MHPRRIVACVAVSILATPVWAGSNLLRNPGFEDIPGPLFGEGIMPSEWTVIQVTPDTYSTDGSFGLPPAIFGNFTGVLAHSGVRWIAGWSLAVEVPGQLLSDPLVPGKTYRLSAYLHQAQRADLANPGAYELRLAPGPSMRTTVVLGSWAPTATPDQWEYRSIDFVAPPEAAKYQWLLLVPYGERGGSAYPGVDDTALVAVDCPADLDGDGQVGAADLAVLLGAWGGSGPADLDGSGSVDASDLAMLLGAWGTC
jgi:hypothetical protein